jgi:inhibitor of KinA
LTHERALMIYGEPLLKPSGDHGFRITFGDERTLEVNKPVRVLTRSLETTPIPGVEEIIPTYASVTLLYQPSQVSYQELVKRLSPLARACLTESVQEPPYRLVIIPVCYRDEYAPDMGYVCRERSLSSDQVIQIHTGQPYYVFQLGFTPGCPFIGPLQEELHVPLMQSPRTHTPAGAVAISVGQTVIYPSATPGGMRIVGRTPARLFQIDHPELTLLKPGDRVKFRAISREEFGTLEKEIHSLFEGVEVTENVRD